MKYKIGDKVILKSKYGSQKELRRSVVYRRITKKDQPFAYITGIFHNTNMYMINDVSSIKSGDYYEEDDVDGYLNIERKLKLKKLNEKR